jgi:heme-degrading monooxygenase HmoA
MVSRVTTFTLKPGRMEELATLYEVAILPAVQQQAGFRGSLLLRDPDAQKALLITFWDTHEHRRATEATGDFKERLGRLQTILAAPPETAYFEAGNRMPGDTRTPSAG